MKACCWETDQVRVFPHLSATGLMRRRCLLPRALSPSPSNVLTRPPFPTKPVVFSVLVHGTSVCPQPPQTFHVSCLSLQCSNSPANPSSLHPLLPPSGTSFCFLSYRPGPPSTWSPSDTPYLTVLISFQGPPALGTLCFHPSLRTF